ncbi:MAG: thioredoxin family protein [Pirellulales bacterium]
MTNITFALMLLAALAAAPADEAPRHQTYAQAHRLTAQTGRPLVVLVGADWCSACRQMKQGALPQVAQRGLLNKVSFAVVNTDHEGPLAKKLMRETSIPQLIMYRKTSDGWRRHSMVGARTPAEIESFIGQGLAPSAAEVSAK